MRLILKYPFIKMDSSKKTINHLPSDVKRIIISYLKEEDIKSIRLLNKEWISTVNESEKWTIVTNSNHELTFEEISQSFRRKGATFQSFTLLVPTTASFPQCLDILSFRGGITNHGLLSILAKCSHLRELHFEDVEYSDKVLTGDTSYIELPLLRKISVTCKSSIYYFRLDEEKLFNFLAGLTITNLQQFRCFCSNKILDRLDISVLFNHHAEFSTMLFKFLVQKKASLNKIVLGDPKQPFELILGATEKLRESPLQLQGIHSYYNVPLTYDLMFRLQYNLNSLRLNGALSNYWFVNQAIFQSSNSITSLHLAGNGKFRIYDFSSLAFCNNLQELTLNFTDTFINPFPLLSTKLLSLSLCGPLTGKTLQHLSSDLFNLEAFDLEDNFPNRNFPEAIVGEIDAEIVEKFMRYPNLTALSFRRCLMEQKHILEWCHNFDNIRTAFHSKEDNPEKNEGILIERLFLME